MLKTLWKVWKGLRFYHKIWAVFPRFLPVLPHILGLEVKMSMTFTPVFPGQAFTFLMMSLTVSRRCWSFFMSRSMVFRE